MTDTKNALAVCGEMELLRVSQEIKIKKSYILMYMILFYRKYFLYFSYLLLVVLCIMY